MAPPVSASQGMTIDESARRLGAMVWVERRLFEIIGRWAGSTPEPTVKLELARRSRHHAAHAEAIEAVLPDTRDHDPVALVAAPDPGAQARVEQLGALTATHDRLAALVDELVRERVAASEDFLAEASAVRDGPAIRVLIVVLAEERAELTDLARLRPARP